MMACALAMGLMLLWGALAHPPGTNWHPHFLTAMAYVAVSASIVRFCLLLCDVVPGSDIHGVWLYSFRGVGVASNPLRWKPWPVATYQRDAWPRAVAIQWLFFLIVWHYSPQPIGEDQE